MSLFDIDFSARAKARASIVIAAPRDAVWARIADPETWPNWNHGVEWVGAVGRMTPGTKFEWRAGGMTFRSTVQALDAPSFIGWTSASTVISELWLNLGDAHHQAARFSVSAETSTPSLNLIPSMTFGNWFLPLRRSHFFDAA